MKGFTTQLSNIPSLIFYQNKDGDWCGEELPIHIKYFNGSIVLTQGKDSIIIAEDFIESLFKSIKSNHQEAKNLLNLKYNGATK